MHVVFAVPRRQVDVYETLVSFIDGSTVGVLTDSSSNVVELIRDNYEVVQPAFGFNSLSRLSISSRIDHFIGIRKNSSREKNNKNNKKSCFLSQIRISWLFLYTVGYFPSFL